MATTVKRRKPKALRKEDMVRVRVTTEQKKALAAAADRAGLDVSSWLRAVGLAEAQKGAEAARGS